MTMICHPVLDITSLPLSWLYFGGVSYICLNYDFIVLELLRVCLNILCLYRKRKIKEDRLSNKNHSFRSSSTWLACTHLYSPSVARRDRSLHLVWLSNCIIDITWASSIIAFLFYDYPLFTYVLHYSSMIASVLRVTLKMHSNTATNHLLVTNQTSLKWCNTN